MLLGTLGTSLSRNILAEKRIIRAGDGVMVKKKVKVEETR